MNRTYAAKRLLEHGALSMAEFKEITRWTPRQARKTMLTLLNQGIVKRVTRLHKNTWTFGLTYENTAISSSNGTQQKQSESTNDAGRTCRG